MKTKFLKMKTQKGKGFKILISKQMFQRLLIALTQAKAGNASENLLNKIHQIIYFCIKQMKLLKKI